jgi:hypothetical protein
MILGGVEEKNARMIYCPGRYATGKSRQPRKCKTIVALKLKKIAGDGFGTVASCRMKIVWALSALSTILLCIPRKQHSSVDRSHCIKGASLCKQFENVVCIQSF